MVDYNTFVKSLKESREAQWQASVALMREGFIARIIPFDIVPEDGDRAKYRDGGDIEIRQIIQVKQWREENDFHTMEDVKYRDIIVDVPHNIESINLNTLNGYLIVNRDVTCGIWIPAYTAKFWFKAEKYDSREEKMKWFYFCPKNKCFFKELREVKR